MVPCTVRPHARIRTQGVCCSQHSNSLTVRCCVGAAARLRAFDLKLKSTGWRDGPRGRWQWNMCKSRPPLPYRPRAPSDDIHTLTTPQEYRARVVQHIPSESGHSSNLTTPQYPPNQPSSNLTHTARSDTSEDLKTRTSMPPMGFSSSAPAQTWT